ncbi:hypothetical protein EJC51_00805 [Streptomyces aquilus]|uniref:Uncharacterized protein n=1 Tax=Streptomyces aquilus TaxID=2548456 RepID=A0A3S9HRR8_9ACTN|nr:hypothetical protein EJC51_00805 [Streptomyces aquilus]
MAAGHQGLRRLLDRQSSSNPSHQTRDKPVWRQLNRQGQRVARRTGERLMREIGIADAVHGRKVVAAMPDPTAGRAAPFAFVEHAAFPDVRPGAVEVLPHDLVVRVALAAPRLRSRQLGRSRPLGGCVARRRRKGCRGGVRAGSEAVERYAQAGLDLPHAVSSAVKNSINAGARTLGSTSWS